MSDEKMRECVYNASNLALAAYLRALGDRANVRANGADAHLREAAERLDRLDRLEQGLAGLQADWLKDTFHCAKGAKSAVTREHLEELRRIHDARKGEGNV